MAPDMAGVLRVARDQVQAVVQCSLEEVLGGRGRRLRLNGEEASHNINSVFSQKKCSNALLLGSANDFNGGVILV